MSISTRILDGTSGKKTPASTSRPSASYTVASRLHPTNIKSNPNTSRIAPVLNNEVIKESLCKHSRKAKNIFAKDQPTNITSLWREHAIMVSPKHKQPPPPDHTQYLRIRDNNNSFLEKTMSPEKGPDKHPTTERLYIKNMIKDLERRNAQKVKNKTGLSILKGSPLGRSTEKEPNGQGSFKYLPDGASAAGGGQRNAQYTLY